MKMIPKAVLWDMDGTIIDTEPYWLQAEMELAAAHGVKWDLSDALKQVGQGLPVTAKNMQDAGLPLTIEQLVQQMTTFVVNRVKISQPWRPGALELLRELKAAGVTTALVTMSFQELTKEVLSAIGFEAFDAVVTGDTVTNFKPHPEPYLTAAKLLNVSIEDCIVLEDSIPGVKSGAASGAFTIGLPNHIPIPESQDYILHEGLEDMSMAKLFNLYASWNRRA